MINAIKYSDDRRTRGYLNSRGQAPAGPPPGLLFGLFAGSGASRRRPSRPNSARQGMVLPMVMAVVAVLAVLVSDLSRNAATAFEAAVSERDAVRAEYLARSGLNLTRMLIGKEPAIRGLVAPFYQMILNRRPPQLNVWDFAEEILKPFSDYDSTQALVESSGIDFSQMEGVGKTGGTFKILAVPENSKININKPIKLFVANNTEAKKNIAKQLYALMGGYQPQSPYDIFFSERDADGQYTTRLDIVSDIVDWWDYDQSRTIFDPRAEQFTEAGSEDDIYTTFADPYVVKNAPFDSLEELRLIRGMSDDFWSTFVEPKPDDPKARLLTIYGSAAINVNQADPVVLWARLCSFIGVAEQPLCVDLLQRMMFIQLLSTAKAIIPVAFFSTPEDFVKFAEGGGGDAMNLFSLISAFLGPQSQLLFTPLVIPKKIRPSVVSAFITQADIYTIQSTGIVGRTRVRISSVVNFHGAWTPPPPNSGAMPGMGIFHYYRVD